MACDACDFFFSNKVNAVRACWSRLGERRDIELIARGGTRWESWVDGAVGEIVVLGGELGEFAVGESRMDVLPQKMIPKGTG